MAYPDASAYHIPGYGSYSSSRHHDHDAVLHHPSIFLECLGAEETGLFGVCLECEGLADGANLATEGFGHSGERAVGDDYFLLADVARHELFSYLCCYILICAHCAWFSIAKITRILVSAKRISRFLVIINNN